MLISIENHITCDLSGGSGPHIPPPPPDQHMVVWVLVSFTISPYILNRHG